MKSTYSTQFERLAQKCASDLYDLLANNGAVVKFDNDGNEIKVVVYNELLDCANIVEVSSIYIDWLDEEVRFTTTEQTSEDIYYTLDDLVGVELYAFLYEMTLEQLND